jgi:hypothetical protein
MRVPFHPAGFGPVFGPLLAVDRFPELGPGTLDEQFRPQLEAASQTGFAHVAVSQQLAAKAFMSGMWLLFDFLDESHEISQSLPDEWGAYWHGIMHRREPDPGNAAYWFRRVRDDVMQASVRFAARDFGYAYHDALAFIDDCERWRGTKKDLETRLRRVQLEEIRLLLRRHYNAAASVQF